MKKLNLAVVVSAISLTLTACTGVEKDATYDNVDAFKEAVEAPEGSCPGETPRGQVGDDEQVLRCSDSLTLRLFKTEDETKKGRLGFAIGFMDNDSIVTGPNWIIQGPTDELTNIQKSMGGELSVK